MSQVDSTIGLGHNSGNAALDLSMALGSLGVALQDARANQDEKKKIMVIIARWLLAVDQAVGGNEEKADAAIKQARITVRGDLITSVQERDKARWMARGGGVRTSSFLLRKTPNEINDLTGGALNPVEAKFLTSTKYLAATRYMSVYLGFAGEAKIEIRHAFDADDAARDAELESIRKAYGGMFLSETIDKWIADETYRRSPLYRQIQEMKEAMAHYLENVKDDEQRLRNLELVYKTELAHIRKLAAQKRQDAEQRKVLAGIPAHHRKAIADATAYEEGDDVELTDDNA